MKQKITSVTGNVFEVPLYDEEGNPFPDQPEWGENFTVEIIDETEENKLFQVSQLWQNYNNFAESNFDNNSRCSLLWINQDPQTTQAIKDKIVAIQSWYRTLWTNYGLKKQLILSGEEDINLNCEEPQVPYSIWEIT